MIAFIQNLGPTELAIIAVVLLLLFGGSQLPKFARGLGESIKALRDGAKEFRKELEEADERQG